MNISLTPELEAMVQKRVKSGLYGSASEVVREALRLLYQRDENYRVRLKNLRKEIEAGLEDVAHDRVAPLDMDEIKARARASTKK